MLILGGANTYNGVTRLMNGTTVALSIGANGATSSSFGTNVLGGALEIGNPANSTTVSLLYAGTGETTTRRINLIGTTGTRRIDASGSGALILTDIAVTEAGAKTL